MPIENRRSAGASSRFTYIWVYPDGYLVSVSPLYTSSRYRLDILRNAWYCSRKPTMWSNRVNKAIGCRAILSNLKRWAMWRFYKRNLEQFDWHLELQHRIIVHGRSSTSRTPSGSPVENLHGDYCNKNLHMSLHKIHRTWIVKVRMSFLLSVSSYASSYLRILLRISMCIFLWIFVCI